MHQSSDRPIQSTLCAAASLLSAIAFLHGCGEPTPSENASLSRVPSSATEDGLPAPDGRASDTPDPFVTPGAGVDVPQAAGPASGDASSAAGDDGVPSESEGVGVPAVPAPNAEVPGPVETPSPAEVLDPVEGPSTAEIPDPVETPSPAEVPDPVETPGASEPPVGEAPAAVADPAVDVAGQTAVEALSRWLGLDPQARPELDEQPFASVALSEAVASEARRRLTEDYLAQIRATREKEAFATNQAPKTIAVGGVQMRYLQASRGTKPSGGWNLFISMHGGGGAPASVNDEQWRNQISLVEGYRPENAIWIAPRAPTDEWNMWFREHMDGLFERLVQNMIAFEGVDPNRVYLTGYSAGGDGAYQMGPRMADAWAGVGMSAGHPNGASPLNLRNTAFSLHVGGRDTAFGRHMRVADWGARLEELRAADPEGYSNQWQVHEGLPHWMNLADAVSIPFLQQHERNPVAPTVVWRQAHPLRSRMYWLAVDTADVRVGSTVTASYEGQRIVVDQIQNVDRLTLRVSDEMLDQNLPVEVVTADQQLFSGIIPRTIAVLYSTLQERGDPELVYSGEVTVPLD